MNAAPRNVTTEPSTTTSIFFLSRPARRSRASRTFRRTPAGDTTGLFYRSFDQVDDNEAIRILEAGTRKPATILSEPVASEPNRRLAGSHVADGDRPPARWAFCVKTAYGSSPESWLLLHPSSWSGASHASWTKAGFELLPKMLT